MSKLDKNILTHIVSTLQEDVQDYQHFVETGTYVGETILNLQPHFKQISTIELSLDLFLRFNDTKENAKIQNIKNYLGDTIIVLPGLLMASDGENIIFWLDGHYSGQTWAGQTALGIKECPLLEECAHIDNYCKAKKCIILVDDFSLFEKKGHFDWSDISFNKIQNIFKNYKIKKAQTFDKISELNWSGDIFALTIEK